MNQYGFQIQSGKRDLGIWWVMGWDKDDALKHLALTFSGTAIAHYGYEAKLKKLRNFGDVETITLKEPS